MRTSIPAVAALLVMAGWARLGAIELSLEENRAERGNIGFVDAQRLFKLFPETLKAKENFEEAVRQAEEQINLRQAEVLRLRAQLDALKVEREVLAKSTPASSGNAMSAGAPAASVVASTAPASLKPAVSTAAAAGQLPGFATAQEPAPSSATAALLITINLPGSTTGPVAVSPPSAGPAAGPILAPTPPAAALADLDDKIARKARELKSKEAESRDQQAAAEKNLLDLESRKSEILLGKIYRAVAEVARREGVSVVVDKGGVLYGHNAVDLTDKVLKYLKGG